MHLYNAWLPPPVAALTVKERDSFARVISSVKASYITDDPDSVFSTLKYISVLDLLVHSLFSSSIYVKNHASGFVSFRFPDVEVAATQSVCLISLLLILCLRLNFSGLTT